MSSLFDVLKSQLSGMFGGKAPEEVESHTQIGSELIDMIKAHGLGNLAQLFSAKGLGDVMSSWVGKGSNLPITPEQIEHALGSEQIGQLASKLGLSLDSVKAIAAQVFPSVVDKLTPQGKLEE